MDLLVEDEDEFKDAEISGSEDELQDADAERKRSRLIDSVLALNKKNAKYTQRTIRSKEITEFNFGSSNSSGKIHVGELLQSLVKIQKNKKIKNQLKRIKETDLLKKPLPKHEQEKFDRTTAYQKASEEISAWNSTVWQNRKKEHQEFPLQTEKVEVFNNQTFCKRFVARNPLELEIQALLHKHGKTEQRNKMLTPTEEKVLKAMDINEAKRRRNELMKYKALLNYQELKAKWKGKIKSKNYRRRLKKERLEKEKSNIHELAEKDPEKFEEKMKMVDKSRVKERASLKHRGGSKFQKKQMMYAKYDPNTRDRIAEMVSKNKELTKKPIVFSEESSDESDSSEEEEEEERPIRTLTNSSNSWMSQKNAATKTPVRIQVNPKIISVNKPQEPLVEADNVELITEEVMPTSLREAMPGKKTVEAPAVPENESYVDAGQVLSAGNNISTSMPMLLVNEESEDEDNDDDDKEQMALSQAFADDDVVQAFSEEKRKTVNAENPSDLDLVQPGWGSWCGNGLTVPKWKRKRFTIKANRKRRKDDRLGHVIINEKKDKVISAYQVKEVPFPFTDAKTFARSIRAPIGKEWNSQIALNKLTEPKVTTKSGTIIKPIDKSVLLKKDKE
ncbi:UTP14 [Acanthosepion pharaonis]|uniref:UTP14 n=1 Tax=Acanthosepion pharaonis TaxID=158019 RepID=A0A812BUT8_ACAPH|nr:UTP14 [Sepia pharaonis]